MLIYFAIGALLTIQQMWRDEVGITEMMLAYIAEFTEFRNWNSYRNVVVDILLCHEQARRHGERILEQAVNKPRSNTSQGSYPDIDVNERPTIEGIVHTNEMISERRHQMSNNHLNLTTDKTPSNEAVQECAKVEDVLQYEFMEINVRDDLLHAPEQFNLSKRINTNEPEMPSFHNGDEMQNDFRSSYFTPNTSDMIEKDSTGRSVNPSTSSNDESINRRFKCSRCQKILCTDYLRLRHENAGICRNTKLQCRFCSKLFARKFERDRHERIHTGEKPFLCRFCGKTFSDKANRVTHERIHTGEKPYKCGFCGMAFNHKSNQVKHETVVHKRTIYVS